MKISLILLLLSVCAVFAGNTYSQEAKISLHVTEMSIKEVMNEIERTTSYVFVLSDQVEAEANKKVNVNTDEMPLSELLDNILAGTQLTYNIIDRQVVVYADKSKKPHMPEKEDPEVAEIQQPSKVKITGTVTDTYGDPLAGANVIEVGTAAGVAADMNGNYTIDVFPGATLRFSYIGYKTQEIGIGNRNVLQVEMEEDQESLNEVVVVGYGTIDRRTLTNAVSNIRQEEFIAGTVSPLMAVNGKVPGLSVISTNGSDPNAGVSLQLRGVNSVAAKQGPLIVIDGVPGAEIELVAKEDIESVNVLKDASAAAIYGTRASGGVILVTTKKPAAGKAAVNFFTELSMETVRKKANILSADDFRNYGKTEGGTLDYGASTDWIDAVTRNNPFSQRYVVSASGGNENARIAASANTRVAQAPSIVSDRKELGGRINTYFKFFEDKLELSANVSYTEINANNPDNSIFEKALQINPTYPVYNEDDPSGYHVITGGLEMFNPVAEIKLKSNETESTFLLANATLKLNLTDYWSVSAMAAAKRTSAYGIEYRSAQHRISRESGVKGLARQSYARHIDKTLDLTTNFDKKTGFHGINAVAGYSFQEFNGQGFWAENQDFTVDGLGPNNLGGGSFLSDGRAGMGSSKEVRTRLIAFFGRANYAYDDRYLLTATVRYEGSSKFYRENWGLFPGISLGWRLSSETFMENAGFVNDLKLRAAYGETGNEGFDSTTAFRMYSLDSWYYVDGKWQRVYGLQHNQNKDMKWEIKKEYNAGLDFSVMDYKVSGRLDWFTRKVENMIYSGIPVASPPNVHGFSTVNIGDMTNTGFEAEVNWNVIDKRDWGYKTNLVATFTSKSKLEDMSTDTRLDFHTLPHPGSPGAAVRIFGGQEIGKFFLWKSAGFDGEGKPLIYNANNEVIPYDQRSDLDRRQLGNGLPKAVLSWGNDFRYKNWDLNLYFRSWLGHDVFNVTNMYLGTNTSFSQGRNVLKAAFEENAFISYDGRIMTDYWLENGSFVKLDAVTLGYTFDRNRIKPFSRLRLTLTARDLFTLTGYKGLDPEVNVNGLDPGFEDLSAYPRTRTFMLGIQVGF
ncbi:MAG: SusC/RagA family TonB-linked outer membrane protein [Tannerella sp.]|nr:SusC/RagA family TonB-linked outer membrane protein [Tannerella sp.]